MFRVHLFAVKIYKIIALIEFSVKLFIELISDVDWLQLIVGESKKRRVWKCDAFQLYSHVEYSSRQTVFLWLFKFCTAH